MAHAVKKLLSLRKKANVNRTFKIYESPFLPVIQAIYSIINEGIEDQH